MKSQFNKIIQTRILQGSSIFHCLILSLSLNLFVEIMSRHSLLHALEYMFTDPIIFLYNTLLIAFTLSLAYLFPMKNIILFLISLLWVMIGIVDFILLIFRTTPFTASDLFMLSNAISIWKYYMSPWLILLIIAVILMVFGVGIYFIIRWKKSAITYSVSKSLLTSFSLFVLLLSMTNLLTLQGQLAKNYGNIANAYHSYGLPYCFTSSIIDRGIAKPEQYSEGVVNQIISALESGDIVYASDLSAAIKDKPLKANQTPSLTKAPESSEEADTTKRTSISSPNIIMLQLESFFDPATIRGIQFTKDPIPFFRSLMKQYSTGSLSVPSVGAGTANTEFEVITGMNLDFFGPGEYPYNSILQKKTCESVGFVLKDIGYHSHAIHNNTATFYGRNEVFSQLGFDTFTSLEYMKNITYTPTGWAKDQILIPQIVDTLASTKEQDFIYTISVQGHGGYPENDILVQKQFDLSLPFELQEYYFELLYYSHQLYEMDLFLKELVTTLEELGEDTILVMYGDHLPGFPFTEANMTNSSLFQTPYVIWNNIDLPVQRKDLEAYQLYSYVLQQLNIEQGLMNKFHQTQKDSDIYLEELELLEYDMLYGKMNCFYGVNPYIATTLTMGIQPISLFSVECDTSKEKTFLTIKGKNFTPYSRIFVNDEYVKTTLINESTLISEELKLEEENTIKIAQCGNDMVILSETEPVILFKE